MRYGCGSDACLASSSACSFKLKTVSCETSQLCHFYQHEHHVSSSGQSKRPKLSREIKATIQDLVLQDVKPARIRNELIDRLTLTADMLPALKQIQNFIAADCPYLDLLRDAATFSFGYEVDSDNRPVLGDGSDDDPLVIGITTKFLLRAANRDPNKFVFHMDATFKLVLCGYPLMVCGISDSARQFHPVAFSLLPSAQQFNTRTLFGA
eukprot:jgi/Phyca11/100115/e_gw1.4.1084.1